MKTACIALVTATFLSAGCDSRGSRAGDPPTSVVGAADSARDTTPPPPPPPPSGSVATVSVTPDSASMMAGDTGVRLQVVARDSAGNLLARNASWSTPDSSFLYLPSHYGEGGIPVFGRTSGIGTVYATTDGKSAQAKIVVRDVVPVVAVVPGSATSDRVGSNLTFRAALTDAAGTVLKYRLVSWSTTDTTVFALTSVDERNGDSYATIVTRGAGTAVLHATCDGKTGEAAITVSVSVPAPMGSVTVLPDSANLAVGDSAVFTAEVRDPSGNLVSDPPPYWTATATDTSVFTLRAAGFHAVVYTHAVGSLTLSATSGGKSGSASIVVK